MEMRIWRVARPFQEIEGGGNAAQRSRRAHLKPAIGQLFQDNLIAGMNAQLFEQPLA
ncbi:hypothetical protein BH10PSE4_BH10PSE4_34000 [soil metagenome]